MIKKALTWLGYKITSRKFHVFVVGTWLLIKDKITSEQWFWIALAYINANILMGFAKIRFQKKEADE